MNDFKNEPWKKIFDNLVDDIEEQKCILFLGPEVTKVSGTSLQSHLHEYLTKNHAEDISYYYKQEGFFLFKDKLGKEDVQRALRRQIKTLLNRGQIDESIYLKIASIPFHLIISINPDTYLPDLAMKYGLKHRFAYFNHRGDRQNDVETPSRTQPLYFNLCGAKNRDDSFVLDYDDLFSLLQAAIGNPGLPERLKRTLQTSKSFLFLGFQIEKWYAQLLMRLLSGERAIKKFALQDELKEGETKNFLIQQFQVQFLNGESTFLDELHNCCKENNLLRPISTPLKQEQQQIIKYLQNGELQEALNLLLQTTGAKPAFSDYHDQTLLLSSRFSKLENSNEKGILDYREYNLEFNKLVDALLELNKSMNSSL